MMRNSLIILSVLALVSCKSVPPVFVTPETDGLISETAQYIESISESAKTLSETVEEIKPGDSLTDYQVSVIKESTREIVKSSDKAKTDIAKVKESHEEDNKSASSIATDLVKTKKLNAKLWEWVIVLTIIIAISAYVFIKLR